MSGVQIPPPLPLLFLLCSFSLFVAVACVACQQVLYNLPLGFVPIYFFSKSFKDVLKGSSNAFQRVFKAP
uniref:hypothetical protein n=1 Tax=Bartonella grahamii TaxID=33045 RepID=UPI001ABBB1E3